MISKTIVIVIVLVVLVTAIFLVPKHLKISKENLLTATTPSPQPTNMSLRDVKVTVYYEPINAKASDGRDAVDLLISIKADFILRGYFKWGSCLDWYPWVGLRCTYQEHLKSLSELSNLISQLKRERPNLIFGGIITFSHVDPKDTYADGTPIGDDWKQMVFYDKNGKLIDFSGGYVADIASPLWRKWITGWAEKMIDAGVYSFFFDQHFMAAEFKVKQGADMLSIAIEYEKYYMEIVNEVRAYAASKNRTILISFNWNADGIKKVGSLPNGIKTLKIMYDGMDYVVASTNPRDFNTTPPTLTEDWPSVKSTLAKASINLPIVTFLDSSGKCDWCQLYKFAQLSKQDQIDYLTVLDADVKANGILFAYPVWGGEDKLVPSRYDSVKYGTYDTIVQLAKSS